jgi:amino acid transporter
MTDSGVTKGSPTTVTTSSADSLGDSASETARDVSGDIIEDGLRRGLKGRQFVIIALGSIIGPGCLYGLGLGFSETGPLGVLIGFVITGISMWILMQSVGEVATLFPVHGGFVEVCIPPTRITALRCFVPLIISLALWPFR